MRKSSSGSKCSCGVTYVSLQPSRLYARVLTLAFPGRVGEQSRASLRGLFTEAIPCSPEVAMQALAQNEEFVSLSLSIRFNRLRSNLRFRLVLAFRN